MTPPRRHPERHLGNDRTTFEDLFRQPPMFRWIDPIGPTREDTDGPPVRFECPAMSFRIDAPREPRNDREPDCREFPSQASRGPTRRVRRSPRTHDRDPGC